MVLVSAELTPDCLWSVIPVDHPYQYHHLQDQTGTRRYSCTINLLYWNRLSMIPSSRKRTVEDQRKTFGELSVPVY